MKQTSARWAEAVRRSHETVTEVDVHYGGNVIAEGLAVTAGKVTYDRGAAVYARCDVTLAEPLQLNRLRPEGYELVIRKGIRYTDGETELIPLGVFPIQAGSTPGSTMVTQIKASDRSQTVSDARIEDAYQVASATNYVTAIRALIDDGVPGLSYNLGTTTRTSPLLTFASQDDRWLQASGMAKSLGSWLVFDGIGQLTLRAEPTFADLPVWSFVEGDDGVLLEATLELDRGPAYNKVIAESSNAANGDVYRGEAVDDDPTSPTYYYGPFGHKPRFYSSPFLTSDDQAAAAAASILSAGLGISTSLNMVAVPNPALEPGDAVLIRREALGVNEVHLIETLTLDLGTAAMSATSRSRVA